MPVATYYMILHNEQVHKSISDDDDDYGIIINDNNGNCIVVLFLYCIVTCLRQHPLRINTLRF